MSFRTASAIMRGAWLIDKQWADAHMPLVFSFLKGDASAAKMLMGSESEEDDDEQEDATPEEVSKNVYCISPGTDLSRLPKDCIAYVTIEGPMFKSGDWCSYGMEDYAELFYRLRDNINVAGVITDFDTPGGEAAGTATVADSLLSLRAVKPVIGFVDDGICASSGYWQLSACTEIYANQPTSATGSIGVYCTIADWNTYYANEGLPVHDVYAPESSEKNQEYIQSVAGKDDLMKERLSVIAQAFISAVKTNRGGKIVGMDWAKGAMYFPGDAQKLGLIDGVKNYDQVLLRMNTLIRQNKANSNTTNMAFEKLMAAAKAESFGVVEGGFLLTEEQLNEMEAAFGAKDTSLDTITGQLATANGTIGTLTEQVTNLTANLETSAESLTKANTDLLAANDKIAVLEATGPDGLPKTEKKEDEHEKKMSANDFEFQKDFLSRVS